MTPDSPQVIIQPGTLSEYQSLLAEISRIFEDAKDSTLISINKIRNHAFWLIGERIIKVEQKGDIRAQYGTRLIENLARDLSFKYKSGFSETNLRAMRKFYLSHPIQHPGTELSWSHHKLLLGIKDLEKRRYFERVSLEKSWSKRELRQALLDNKIEVDGDLDDAPGKTRGRKPDHVERLGCVRGRLFTYQLADLKLRPEGNLLVVDCGFGISRRVLTDKIYLFSKGEVIETVKDKQEWKIQKSFQSKEQLYTYKAYVVKVLDGNTLIVQIDCGFDTWARQRLQLKGIACASGKGRKGENVRRFIEQALSGVPFVVVRTYQKENAEHFTVDVFYLPGEEDPEVVAGKGRFLNQELLDQKLVAGETC